MSVTEIALRAEGLTKEYTLGKARLRVLRGVSLDVAAGEAVAIVGPSGSGKSTLLHALGGLDAPTAGRVQWYGQDLYALSSEARTRLRAEHIGFVFQAFYLLPELDVLENVLLPAVALYGRRAGGRRSDRAVELLAAVGLSERMHHTPLELSGGEQQRVALARALMNEPEVVLADEPTGNLDTATGAQMLEALFAITRARGHTLVLVTHNEELARRCDRIVTLRDGQVA